MRVSIDMESERPIYRQVADGIKALIARGELREGMPLPTVRQLASDLGVNMNTIATAYRELQTDGLITVRHGSGAVVSARQTTAASRAEMRRALRAVLTEMVLSGMRRADIVLAVSDELRGLTKGAK
jgi:GntR family transcriptional regulator